MQRFGHAALLAGKWFLMVVGGLLIVLILGFLIVPSATRGWTDRWGATPAGS